MSAETPSQWDRFETVVTVVCAASSPSVMTMKTSVCCYPALDLIILRDSENALKITHNFKKTLVH